MQSFSLLPPIVAYERLLEISDLGLKKLTWIREVRFCAESDQRGVDIDVGRAIASSG